MNRKNVIHCNYLMGLDIWDSATRPRRKSISRRPPHSTTTIRVCRSIWKMACENVLNCKTSYLVETVMKKLFCIPLLSLLLPVVRQRLPITAGAKDGGLVYRVDAGRTHQTMHSFGASDAWRAQYVGHELARGEENQIADWLFSMETDEPAIPGDWSLNVAVQHRFG